VDLNGAAWRTSSYSGGNGGQCVQVATIIGHHGEPERMCAVRDSKHPYALVLAFGPEQWRQFTAGIKTGQFGPA
jgi:uncharacterized protein DUF397